MGGVQELERVVIPQDPRAETLHSSLMDLTLDHEENFWLKRARDAADPIELSAAAREGAQ